MERKHMNEIREVIYRLRQGESVRVVAQSLGFARNTVRRYCNWARARGFLDSAVPMPEDRLLGEALRTDHPKRPRSVQSGLTPYAEKIAELHKRKVEMTTVFRILHENHGYNGSYSAVRRYMKRVHPHVPEVFCRIETAPGEEAQVDFGYAGLQRDPRTGALRKAWVFVMTLAWSRHQYVEFVFDQNIETWLECHAHAFARFGGAPQRIVLDNLKAGVVKPDLHSPILNTAYCRLAEHYGCRLDPNRPRTPRHKGKVENGVRYLKRSFLSGQEFDNLTDMNEKVKRWVETIAGERVHGTTREKPLERFLQSEQAALRALPSTPYEYFKVMAAKVQRDCHVCVDNCYYSVPYAYAGKHVEVYVKRSTVDIFYDCQLLVSHMRGQAPGTRQTRTEHYPEHKRQCLESTPAHCLEQSKAIGPCCFQIVSTLLQEPVHDKRRSVQSLLRLRQNVSAERLEAACRRALHFGDAGVQRIRAILQSGKENEPLEEPAAATTPEANTRPFCFSRPLQSFFEQETSPC